MELLVEGLARAVVGKGVSLAQACQAHELSQTGHGRIVLQIKA